MKSKLKLNKEIIAKLNDDSMNSVQGGAEVTNLCTTGAVHEVYTNKCEYVTLLDPWPCVSGNGHYDCNI